MTCRIRHCANAIALQASITAQNNTVAYATQVRVLVVTFKIFVILTVDVFLWIVKFQRRYHGRVMPVNITVTNVHGRKRTVNRSCVNPATCLTTSRVDARKIITAKKFPVTLASSLINATVVVNVNSASAQDQRLTLLPVNANVPVDGRLSAMNVFVPLPSWKVLSPMAAYVQIRHVQRTSYMIRIHANVYATMIVNVQHHSTYLTRQHVAVLAQLHLVKLNV
jgi:hypothetical protein